MREMSDTTRLVLFGTGQFSETLCHYLDMDPSVTVEAFCIDADYMPDSREFRGRPVHAWEELEAAYPPDSGIKLLGPISFRDGNRFRRDRYLEGKERGYEFHTYIHPGASVYTEDVGENCVILESTIVQPFSTIGNNVILWSFNHIGHHSKVGDHCFFAGMVGVSGNCEIGEICFFGGQSGVGDNVKIGEGCIIGFGARVIDDLEANAITMPPKGRTIPGAARKFARRLL